MLEKIIKADDDQLHSIKGIEVVVNYIYAKYKQRIKIFNLLQVVQALFLSIHIAFRSKFALYMMINLSLYLFIIELIQLFSDITEYFSDAFNCCEMTGILLIFYYYYQILVNGQIN